MHTSIPFRPPAPYPQQTPAQLLGCTDATRLIELGVNEAIMSPQQATSLGAFITTHRLRAGLTIPALAERAGLDKSAVMRLERGDILRPTPDKLERLATALDVEPEDLFALAGYLATSTLPDFAPYLRAKLAGELPDEALKQLEDYYELLRHRYGEEGEPDA